MAYHSIQGCSYYRVCGCWRYSEPGWSIRVYGNFHYWHLRSQLSHFGLVRQRLWSNKREEGRGHQYRDDDYEHLLRLDALSLA